MAVGLALFDFDGTLLPGDSIVSFLRFARTRGALPLGEWLGVLGSTAKYLLGGMTDADIKTRSLRFLNALPSDKAEALARDFVQALIPKIYPAGLAELRRHQAEGRLAVLVTASTENYMRFMAEGLGFDAVLCTPLNPDHSVTANCKGPEKVRRVQRWLTEAGLEADFRVSWAYGDSGSDEAMLRLCGHPVLVNPKGKLRRALPNAQTVHWT